MTVNVLGESYEIEHATSGDDVLLERADGYCDYTTHKVVLCDMLKSADSVADLEAHKRCVLRHELVHAFFYESGLGSESYGSDEQLVDWIALQFPKLLKAFQDAHAL